jgi:hypothetical protein
MVFLPSGYSFSPLRSTRNILSKIVAYAKCVSEKTSHLKTGRVFHPKPRREMGIIFVFC